MRVPVSQVNKHLNDVAIRILVIERDGWTVIRRQYRLDPQRFDTRVGVKQIVDRGILKGHMLQFRVHFFISVFLQLRYCDYRQSVMCPIIRKKSNSQGSNSPISPSDVARVVSTILEDPTGHRGKVYELTGPRSEDMNEMAKEYATALNRSVKYVNVPYDKWLKEELMPVGLSQYVFDHNG